MDAYANWCEQVIEAMQEPLQVLGFVYQGSGFDRGDADTFPLMYGANFEAEDHRCLNVFLTMRSDLMVVATVEAHETQIARLSYRDDQNIASVGRSIAHAVERAIRKAEPDS